DAISGNLKCRLPDPDSSTGGKEIGLAQTSGYLRSGVESERHAAWTAIQHAWHEQREPCAAILNALAGWRLDLVRKRSHTRPIDFLTYPLHKNAIRRETLDAMLTAIRSKIEIPRRGLRCLARALGKSRLDPWDLLSAAPPQMGFRPLPFSEGFELVASAFEAIHPEMGEFARLMLKNSWIEARVLPNKQQGGYCTEFAKSRTPRIFQTYMGSVSDIKTLAHEIGHAYHSWVMRDLKIMERHYPATLAETASVFGETAVAAAMAQASDISMRRAIGWQVAETAAGFLINIPARFEFEKNFYELRNERFVTPDELSELTERAWQSWYGDTLAQTDRLYWASKLHFSMAGTSFYNFPYAFGYLFSVGLYARRESEGPAFFNTYKRILLDTGRMTAEDLIHKHLGEDISQPDFWLRSLELVERKIAAFEPLLT
ncbi:MAG: M3 family metallopeptidase, partial [Bdellovibrionaceae bacterium]|nr:M3 family metallopeptidase [Pseudobdellovibrionaceae bacterium]